MNFALKTLTILASGSVAALAITSNAEAATFVSPDILLQPATLTPFPNPTRISDFDKFDSTGKNITGVRAFLDGRLFGQVTFINTDDDQTMDVSREVFEYTQRGRLTARGPGGVPEIITVFPQETLIPPIVTLEPEAEQTFEFDTTASEGPLAVDQINWDLFATAGGGSGEINWLGRASALSDIDNGIDVVTRARLEGTFRFEVDYDDNGNPTNPPVTTPEPATLLSLFAVVGTAGLAGRRRKKS